MRKVEDEFECCRALRIMFVVGGPEAVADEFRARRMSMSEVNSGRVESIWEQVPNDEDGAIHCSLIVDDEPPNLLNVFRPTEHGVSTMN